MAEANVEIFSTGGTAKALREAGELGLVLSTETPTEILDLLALFPKPVSRMGGLEFGPDLAR